MPQRLCSSANVFTYYCLLIDQIALKDITLNRFADDHSPRKSFPAGNRTQEQKAKHRMELTFSNIKEWMDSMHLKLNSEKTEYIMFGSFQQLTKINPEQLQTEVLKYSLEQYIGFVVRQAFIHYCVLHQVDEVHSSG